MHHTHGNLAVERFARAAVVQGDLGFGVIKAQFLHIRVVAWVRQFQHVVDFFFLRAVKHGGGKSCAFAQIVGQQQDFVVRQAVQVLFMRRVFVVQLIQELADFFYFALFGKHFVCALAYAFCRPAQVHFQNLTDVHPRRYTQRVEHDVHGTAVCHVRHIFHRQNA